MEIRGLSVQGGFNYQFSDDFKWQLTGSGIDLDLNADFDANRMFWAKFRTFFSAGSGAVKHNHQRLADVDDWQLGLGLLAGVRIYNDDGNSISFGAGFGMGFGMMDVHESDAGKVKWEPDCPDFAGIVEDPSELTCYLEKLDGMYTSKKFMAEMLFDFGPITLSPSFEVSFNSRKKGQVLAPTVYALGVSAGVNF